MNNKYTAPRVKDIADLQRAIDTIYRDINNINEKLNAKVSPEAKSDVEGKPGMTRVLQDGNKVYLGGKTKEGWKDIEIITDLSDQLNEIKSRLSSLESV